MFARKRQTFSSSDSSRDPLVTAAPSINNTAAQHAPVKVILRVRPMLDVEAGPKFWQALEVIDEHTLIFDPKVTHEDLGTTVQIFGDAGRTSKNLQFHFDQVFGSNCSNEDVYNGAIKESIGKLINGINCSIFAYGPTGSGKTYTMLGSGEQQGLTHQLMSDLYEQLTAEENLDFDTIVSYLEIYNENVRDLLRPSSNELSLREDGKEIFVHGLTWYRMTNLQELMEKLHLGNDRRTQHPTDANAESSRSHAVFQVRLNLKVKNEHGTVVSKKWVRLNMIDLAGSERAAANNNNALRLQEGANINKSLLALGNCISALACNRRHIPYRDSKLTRLLKGVLGGNSFTVMIANVSPSSRAYEDTYNTLKYATRAKKIKNRLLCNEGKIRENVVVFRLNSALEKAQNKIAAMTAKEKELETRILAFETAPDSSKELDELVLKLRAILSAKHDVAIATDLSANIECHLQEMSARFDEKTRKFARLKSLAPSENFALEKVEEQRAAKCASLEADLKNAKEDLEKVKDYATAIELDLEQWLSEHNHSCNQLVETVKQLREYKAMSEFVVCQVQKNHLQSALKKKSEENNELQKIFCLVAEQYSKLFNHNRDLVTIDMINNYHRIKDMVRTGNFQVQDLGVEGPGQAMKDTRDICPLAFSLKHSPSTASRSHRNNAAALDHHHSAFEPLGFTNYAPAPFILKNTPSRVRTVSGHLTPPARSVDQTQPETKRLIETTMAKVSNYELCLVDMREVLHRHESEIKMNQETNLSLISKLEEVWEVKFAKCNTQLNNLENGISVAQAERNNIRSGVSLMQTQFGDFKSKFDVLTDLLTQAEMHSGQQLELLQMATKTNANELKELITCVHACGQKLQEHILNSKTFVVNLENYLNKRASEVDSLREQMLLHQEVLNKDVSQLGQVLDGVSQAGDKRDDELASLKEQWSQFREEQLLQMQLLQNFVQENKQELDKAVDVITKLDCLQVAAPSGGAEMKEDLAKATMRLAKVEMHVKTHLAKLSKYIDGKNNSASGGASKEKDVAELQQKMGYFENELLENLKLEIEDLKKEKGELVKEVKYLKQARKSENSSSVELQRRLEALETTAGVSKSEMGKLQDVLQKITSSLLTRVDEDIVIKKSLQETRNENNKKFEVVLDLIEPVMKSMNRKVGEGIEPIQTMCSPLTKAAKGWKNELENTLDEDLEKQTVLEKLTIEKDNGDATGLSRRALLHFGDALRLKLTPEKGNPDSPPEGKIKCPVAASATRRVSSKVPNEKGAPVKCVADHKYRDYYARVVPAAVRETALQTNYIKKNINNARSRPSRSSIRAAVAATD